MRTILMTFGNKKDKAELDENFQRQYNTFVRSQ